MLSFIYTDVLPDVHEITGSASSSSFTNMIQHLLAAADLYDLGRLKILCEVVLCEKLNVDNVATTLALAEQHQFLQLKAFCLKFVASPGNLRGECCIYTDQCHFKSLFVCIFICLYRRSLCIYYVHTRFLASVATVLLCNEIVECIGPALN